MSSVFGKPICISAPDARFKVAVRMIRTGALLISSISSHTATTTITTDKKGLWQLQHLPAKHQCIMLMLGSTATAIIIFVIIMFLIFFLLFLDFRFRPAHHHH